MSSIGDTSLCMYGGYTDPIQDAGSKDCSRQTVPVKKVMLNFKLTVDNIRFHDIGNASGFRNA